MTFVLPENPDEPEIQELSCEEARSRFLDYALDTLSVTHKAEVVKHVNGCDRCFAGIEKCRIDVEVAATGKRGLTSEEAEWN